MGAATLHTLWRHVARGTCAALAAGVRHVLVASVLALTACSSEVTILTEDHDATSGASIASSYQLSGCRGHASTAIPADGEYTLTTFGGAGDEQAMSCGGYADGSGWYAASRQRYGCGSRIRLTANGHCVVVATNDYGPDVCVEAAAHGPIIDVTPRAARVLFGMSEVGWSDHLVVTVEEVGASTPLGDCAAPSPPPPPDTTPMTCHSATLDRDVDAGTCVQAASDGVWYQCNGEHWVTPVDEIEEVGPIGACTDVYPL